MAHGRTVVIGGGIMGSCIAWFLREPPDPADVVVIERDPTYQRSSTALSAAGIRTQFSLAVNLRMSLFGDAFQERMDAKGDGISRIRRGYLTLAGPEGAAQLAANYAMQTEEGAEIAWLDRDTLARLRPWLNVEDLECATYGLKHEGWCDAYALLRATRAEAIGMGARFVADEAVAIDVEGDRAVAVRTAGGERLVADHVIIAAGPASGRIAAWVGAPLPVEPRKRTVFVIRTPLPPADKPLIFDTSGAWIRPEGEGFICGISPTVDDPDPDATDDFEPDLGIMDDQLWALLAHRIPALEELRVVRAWAGHYDQCTLDHNAVIGRYPEIPNLYFATGFSGHGVQHGPATGRGIAELIRYGEYRTLDLSPLGYARVRANEPMRELAVY
jgi:glycine/D-amino acid oxidase-like deaminating enzyme